MHPGTFVDNPEPDPILTVCQQLEWSVVAKGC